MVYNTFNIHSGWANLIMPLPWWVLFDERVDTWPKLSQSETSAGIFFFNKIRSEFFCFSLVWNIGRDCRWNGNYIEKAKRVRPTQTRMRRKGQSQKTILTSIPWFVMCVSVFFSPKSHISITPLSVSCLSMFLIILFCRKVKQERMFRSSWYQLDMPFVIEWVWVWHSWPCPLE